MTPTAFDVLPDRGRRGPSPGRRRRHRPIGRHAAPPAPRGARGRDAGPGPDLRRGGRLGRLAGEVLLTLGALLGVAVTVFTVAAGSGGVQPLVVRSGSMEPTVATGSMVLVRRVPAAQLRVGDIVAVTRPDRTTVIHRIIRLDRQGAVAVIRLKGDANPDPDPALVTVVAADRLAWRVPLAGRAAGWLATAPGGFAVGAVMAAMATAILVRRSSAPGPPGALAGGLRA
ncbi:MAG TPA: signal peptidase I [Acidimicrobiales bacterium]|nr:signal peptidase I [Acidimicrobiales bacterium]